MHKELLVSHMDNEQFSFRLPVDLPKAIIHPSDYPPAAQLEEDSQHVNI